MEQFNKIEIISFKRIRLAHSLAVQDYRFNLKSESGENGVIEIGFVEQNPLILDSGAETVTVDEYSVFIIPPGSQFKISAKNKGIHRHTTTEFIVSSEVKQVSTVYPPADKVVIAPLVIPPSKENTEIIKKIREIVTRHTSLTKRNYFSECADFAALLALIAERVCDITGDRITPANRRYCTKAKTYISNHLDDNIHVGDIAAEVGISKNYLTNIFNAGEGLSIVEYINRLKLSRMLELMQKYGYSVSEAGRQVGFFDASYISRIFPRYYGMTVSEYKRSRNMEKQKDFN